MTCEDVELELSGGTPGDAARLHLESCANCQATAKVLGLATLPPLSDTERLLLAGLESSTRRELRDQKKRSAFLPRVASLGLAAGLGALLASVVVMRTLPAPEPRVETRTVMMTAPELPGFQLDEGDDFNLSDDDVFFDVGWPSPTEGDL